MNIQLQPAEETLRKEIEERVQECRKAFESMRVGDDVRNWILEAGQKAHELHLALKQRGHEPRHHGYMIKNRELQPDDPEFYMHFHPLEDLLKFLDDENANDDPVDISIGKEFIFKVYTRRWKHNDTYHITRTADGWHVRHKAINGDCDKTGHPILFMNFNQDYVCYPEGIGDWFEWLWNQAAEKGLSTEQVQQGLTDLSEWVRITESNIPRGDIWKGYAE